MRRGVAALVAGLTASGCSAADPLPDPRESAAVSYTGAAMADHLGRQLDILGGKMVSLARATPEDSYEWAPMDGVRSVGAVFAHVAADNFYVPALVGRPVDGTGITTDSGISDYEAARGSKDEIVAALEHSFQEMEAALAATRDDLDREIMLRDQAITTGDLWVRAIVHLHEHLGQSIAYARSNRVTPPWSAGG